MSFSYNPKLFDVIASNSFVNGSQMGNVIAIEPDNANGDAVDSTRAQAKFVVESIEERDPGCFGVGRHTFLARARKLREDLTHDPDGELIQIECTRAPGHSSLEVVGRMKLTLETRNING